MAGMTAQEALALLYELRREYVRLVVHLEGLEPGRWFEQSEPFRLQAHDALHALIPAVHGAPGPGVYAFLCDVCHLRLATFVPGMSDQDEQFYCDGCRPQDPATSTVRSGSTTS